MAENRPHTFLYSFVLLTALLAGSAFFGCLGKDGGGGRTLTLEFDESDSLFLLHRIVVYATLEDSSAASGFTQVLYDGPTRGYDFLKRMPLSDRLPETHRVVIKGYDSTQTLRLHRVLHTRNGAFTGKDTLDQPFYFGRPGGPLSLPVSPSDTLGKTDSADTASLLPPLVEGSGWTRSRALSWTVSSRNKPGGSLYIRVHDPAVEERGTLLGGNRFSLEAPADGNFTLFAQEVFPDGRRSPLGSATWKVDTQKPAPPLIRQRPSPLTNSRGLFWSWKSGGGAGLYQFSIEDSAALLGKAPTADTAFTFRAAPDGAHLFRIRETDSAGNWSDIATFRTTVDSTPPVLTASISLDTVHRLGEVYKAPARGSQIKAVDAREGEVSARITIESGVKAAEPGSYVETFTVQDSLGNASSLTRRVKVIGWQKMASQDSLILDLKTDAKGNLFALRVLGYTLIEVLKWSGNSWQVVQAIDYPFIQWYQKEPRFKVAGTGDVWILFPARNTTSDTLIPALKALNLSKTEPELSLDEGFDFGITSEGWAYGLQVATSPDGKPAPLISRVLTATGGAWSSLGFIDSLSGFTAKLRLEPLGSTVLCIAERDGKVKTAAASGFDFEAPKTVGEMTLLNVEPFEGKLHALAWKSGRPAYFEVTASSGWMESAAPIPFTKEPPKISVLSITRCGALLGMVSPDSGQATFTQVRQGSFWKLLPFMNGRVPDTEAKERLWDLKPYRLTPYSLGIGCQEGESILSNLHVEHVYQPGHPKTLLYRYRDLR